MVGLDKERPETAVSELWPPHERVEASFFVTRRRLEGYREALKAEGVIWEEVAIVERSENSEAEGVAAMRSLLSKPAPPTAVLCLTDRLALGALEAAQQAGLAVPVALPVVGFNDITTFALLTISLIRTAFLSSPCKRACKIGYVTLDVG